MTVWVALLKGVNVGGHNKLPMADFRTSLTKAGLAKVRTYIQSGNVVFESGLEKDSVLALIEDVLDADFGLSPSVLIRSGADFQRALERRPEFGELPDGTFVHFAFHDCEKGDIKSERIAELAGEDLTGFGDQVFYFHTPNGFSKSTLAQKLPTCFGGPLTVRNMNSVQKIADMVSG